MRFRFKFHIILYGTKMQWWFTGCLFFLVVVLLLHLTGIL